MTTPSSDHEMHAVTLDPVMDTAIDWMVRFTSGQISDEERQQFQDWLRENERHAVVWELLQQKLAKPFEQVNRLSNAMAGQAQLVRRVLVDKPRLTRRQLLGGGAALGVMALAGPWLYQAWQADLRTGVGERQQLTLADGSRLDLNACSGVDIRFSDTCRKIRLRQGEIVIHATADDPRPIVIETVHGRVRAEQGRFLVRLDEQRTRVTVLEKTALLTNPPGNETLLAETESAWLTATRIVPITEDLTARSSWVNGQLFVQDDALQDVIAALRPYQRGYIRVSPAAAGLRVFGVFQLDNSDAALRSLAGLLPIRLRHYGPWLTLIDTV